MNDLCVCILAYNEEKHIADTIQAILTGNGEMNFQTEIHLTFYAQLGRGELDIPVVGPLLSGASRQILLLHVKGTLQNPEPSREALPGLNQAWQQFQNDFQNRK